MNYPPGANEGELLRLVLALGENGYTLTRAKEPGVLKASRNGDGRVGAVFTVRGTLAQIRSWATDQGWLE